MTGLIPALAADRVSKRYGAVAALDQVSLAVHQSEAIALVGESGSGKTTLLRCFNRLVEPDQGRVLLAGTDARSLDPIRLRRRLGYVPQEGGLLPHWRVLRNVMLVPMLRRMPDADGLAHEALRLVGLSPDEFAGRWPRELSGGQRQRVAIARALAARPEVLLLDEPFGALDAITRSELQDAFESLRHELGLTAVLVTHDLAEAARLGDRIAVLHRGRLDQVADFPTLVSHPATAYVERLISRVHLRSLSGSGS